MFSPFVFWPCFSALLTLALGAWAARNRPPQAADSGRFVVLGRILVAASLAAFGAEHLVSARFVMQAAPVWIPGRLFWTYFVGVALLAAAGSLAWGKYVYLSATLLGIMLFSFVLLLHLPGVVAHPDNRFTWTVALRDLAFGGGAWALAGYQRRNTTSKNNAFVILGRLCVAIPLLFFGVQHFLHPDFAPGVPLAKKMPGWMPFPTVWSYGTGTVLLLGGTALLANRKARQGAVIAGLVVLGLTLVVYLPLFLTATQPAARLEGINYVADTLLFAGTILLLAHEENSF